MIQRIRQLFLDAGCVKNCRKEIRQHLSEQVEALMADRLTRDEDEFTARRGFDNN